MSRKIHGHKQQSMGTVVTGKSVLSISLTTTPTELSLLSFITSSSLAFLNAFELYRFEKIRFKIEPQSGNVVAGIIAEDLQTAFTTATQVLALPNSCFSSDERTTPTWFSVGKRFLLSQNTTKWWKVYSSTNSNNFQNNQWTIQIATFSGTATFVVELFWTVRATALIGALSGVPRPVNPPLLSNEESSDYLLGPEHELCIAPLLRERGKSVSDSRRLCNCSLCQKVEQKGKMVEVVNDHKPPRN